MKPRSLQRIAWAGAAFGWGMTAMAQVTPAEPFGGRPFGAATAPVPSPQPAPSMQPVPQVPQVQMPPQMPQMQQPPQMQAMPQPVPQPAPPPVALPPQAPPAMAQPQPPAAPRPMQSPAPAPAAPPVVASTSQAQPVKGLPPDAPKLVISGGVYSANPTQRMLIVNGQVFREGADLGAGVVLQQVRPESAVLGFRGERYNVYF